MTEISQSSQEAGVVPISNGSKLKSEGKYSKVWNLFVNCRVFTLMQRVNTSSPLRLESRISAPPLLTCESDDVGDFITFIALTVETQTRKYTKYSKSLQVTILGMNEKLSTGSVTNGAMH